MDTLITLSQGERYRTLKLREFNQQNLFMISGDEYVNDVIRVSETELDLDGTRLVGEEYVIQALWFAYLQKDRWDDVMEVIRDVKECNFFFANGFTIDEADRTRLKMGMNNAIFRMQSPFAANCIRLADIEGGVRVSFVVFYPYDTDAGQRESTTRAIDIISLDDLNKDIFVQTLEKGFVSLRDTNGDGNFEFFLKGNERRSQVSMSLILGIFEELTIEKEKKGQM